jgi:hypothetical protein
VVDTILRRVRWFWDTGPFLNPFHHGTPQNPTAVKDLFPYHQSYPFFFFWSYVQDVYFLKIFFLCFYLSNYEYILWWCISACEKTLKAVELCGECGLSWICSRLHFPPRLWEDLIQAEFKLVEQTLRYAGSGGEERKERETPWLLTRLRLSNWKTWLPWQEQETRMFSNFTKSCTWSLCGNLEA